MNPPTSALILPLEKIDPTLRHQIKHHLQPQKDYLSLQDRLNADTIDFSIYSYLPYRCFRRSDRLGRLAWGQALYALKNWKNYDVVYSLGEDIAVPLAFLLRLRGLRPRHIMVAHNILSSRKVPLLRALQVMSCFDTIVIFSSHAVRELVHTYGVDYERVRFIMDAIDESFWQPDPLVKVEADLVLSVGRARRDYNTLLTAVADLPLRLRIQSSSQWDIAYRSHNIQRRPPDNVEVGDYLSYCDLRALYNRASFVVISLESGAHHSAGTVSIKEAMAMGKAIIVASDGGANDYVQHGETGLLVPPGDPMRLRQAIGLLIADPIQTKEMGRKGRAFLEQKMGYEAKIEWLASLAT